MKRFVLCVALGFGLSAPALASPLEGVWLTPPDQKRQTGVVQVTRCGAALCGTVTHAYNKAGTQVQTVAVGQEVLRGVDPATLAGGRVYVPTMRASFPVTLQVEGDRLNLRACNSMGICRSQVWTRLP